MSAIDHKAETRKQWNRTPCGTGDFLADAEKDSLDYFERIRRARYESDEWMLRTIPFAQTKGKRVLEIGHGIGSDLVTFAEAGAEVCGVDITEEHHRLATQNFAARGLPVELKLCDAAQIDYPSEHFDIVYSHGVLHHTPDTVRCIGEAYRVLRRGGLFILSLYRTYSAFHLFAKLMHQGCLRGDLFRLGYGGLMATIEQGADGITVKPLVKTYRRAQLRHMLADFSSVTYKVGHFRREHIPVAGWLIPRFAERWLEPALGWYIVAFATR
jgi:ubiquinone/menaquinone biosynthesis C-methylase UbiE